MGYLLLAGAIACEVFATTMMKMSSGFTVLAPSAACVGGYIACYIFLSRALLHIDLSIAYAVWCGVGIIATSVIALLLFGEQLSAPTVLGIALILVGTVLVNLCGSAH